MKPALSDEIKKKIYPGWNDQAAIEKDWAEQGENKWANYQRSQSPVTAQGPSAADRAAFDARLKGEETNFLNRFKTEYPDILSGLETSLGLPGLRQTRFGTQQRYEEMPEAITAASLGKDVTASQLERMIGSRQQDLLPAVQKAVSQEQFATEEFGRQSERALKPFETELDLMKDRFSREATGFNTDVEGRLNLLLTQIQEEGATDRAKIQEATQLAQLEDNKEQLKNAYQTVDLGNRIAILDVNGREISSLAKGKLSSTPNEKTPTSYIQSNYQFKGGGSPSIQNLQPTSTYSKGW